MGKNDPLASLRDADRYSQTPIARLRARGSSPGGMWEYGVYDCLVQKMRREPGFRLRFEDIDLYAVEFGIDVERLKMLIEDCLRISGLFAQDENGDYFWDLDLLQKMERFGATRQRLSEAGRIGAERRAERAREAQATPTKLEATPTNSEATPPEIGSHTNEKTSFVNITITECTSTDQKIPVDPPPHPYLKYLNTAMQDLSSGRYAMKSYPFMWMHPQELQDAREQWERAGLTLQEWRDGLRACNVTMEGKTHDIRFKGGLAMLYLTTHILTNALERKRKELDVKVRIGDPPPKRRSTPVRMPNGQPEAIGTVLQIVAPTKEKS